MKAIRMLFRNIRDAFKSVWRNLSLSLASISCIMITLLIVGVSLIASYNVDNFTAVTQENVSIVVFLERQVTEEEINTVQDTLEKMDNVDEVTFKSKDVAKNEMMEMDEVFREVMSDWTDEDTPLKDGFEVKLKDLTKISTTIEEIKNIEKVSVVRDQQDMVKQLMGTFNIVEKVAYGMVLALVIVTVFLIINTIKLTIFSRKREISIMRLVGASNFSIKVPFVIEGMILGLIGCVIPVGVLIYGYYFMYDHFGGQLFTPIFRLLNPNPFIFYVAGAILALGIVVGMLGSYQAVRKYLKI